MKKDVKKWWENSSKEYQEYCKIPIDIHYGPGSPNEQHYKLLGNLKGKNVLEMGCGGAQCSIAMAKQGAKVIGVDISKEQLKFAKELAKKNKVNITFYERDFNNLSIIKSNSQDIVFSAWAFQYAENLFKIFKEAYRVLKNKGIFIFSLDHPFYRTLNRKTLKLEQSYFDSGKFVTNYSRGKFVMYNRMISDLFNNLIKVGFYVERIIEPDSRKKYPYDPWYNKWELYTPKMMKHIPPTIIFKARKIK